MSKNNGRVWPYAIGASITLVFGFCVATVITTSKANIQESDAYMTHYQDADANINKNIEAEIAFDKKYNITFIPVKLETKGSKISYKVTDKEGSSINNASLVLATSRPETAEFNQKFENPTIEDGVYTFSEAIFPKAGVWNLITKVTIANDYKFYNIKAETRNANSFEF